MYSACAFQGVKVGGWDLHGSLGVGVWASDGPKAIKQRATTSGASGGHFSKERVEKKWLDTFCVEGQRFFSGAPRHARATMAARKVRQHGADARVFNAEGQPRVVEGERALYDRVGLNCVAAVAVRLSARAAAAGFGQYSRDASTERCLRR